MAFADAIQNLFLPAFLREYYQDNIWMSVVNNRSSQLPWGDTLTLLTSDDDIELDTTRTVANTRSTTASDHAWGAPHISEASSIEMKINKFVEVNELIPIMVQRQIRPDMSVSKAVKAARFVREEVNKQIRASAAAVSGNSALTAVASVTAANWNSATHQTNVLRAFARAALSMQDKTAGIVPPSGRVAIVSPDIFDVLAEALLAKNLYLQDGTNERVLARNEVNEIRTFRVMVDNSVGVGHTANDDERHKMFFLRPGEGISYIGQLEQMATMPNDRIYKGTVIQGQYAYAAEVDEPKKIRTIATVIA